jgi:hypothetical protein
MLKYDILNYFSKSKLLNNENDQKQYNNIWKYLLNLKLTKKNLLGKDYSLVFTDKIDLMVPNQLSNLTSSIQNKNLNYRFRDYKSQSLLYLSNEKNIRLLDNILSKKYNKFG